MSLGDNIRRIRKAKGWSQRVLAERICTDASYINRIETSYSLSASQVMWHNINLDQGLGLLDLQMRILNFRLLSTPIWTRHSRCTDDPLNCGYAGQRPSTFLF